MPKNSLQDDRRLIETDRFPIQSVNAASAKEKQGGGRPPYWEMVFWWTRKPLSGSRAVVAGALLPSSVEPYELINWLRLNAEKTPHRLNPTLPDNVREEFGKKRLLDPFAGFGSIPLEAARLGLDEVVAAELLPTAYIFLKAILEYPKRYGRRLVEDVDKWGRWVTDRLREDPDMGELYDVDVAVYIGTWEVKCPVCGRYTPLVGNWWLARVKGKRYAYMKPRAEGDRVKIEIVEDKREGAPQPNVRGRPETAECLLCGSKIALIDPATGRVYGKRDEVKSRATKSRLEFYPKTAIKEWNQKVEEYLEGRIGLDELKNAKARPRLLVKVKIVDKDLKFEPCSEEDNEKLWKALEKLRQHGRDPDIPREPIPEYEKRRITPILGVKYWYQFFNPRQLLTLVKLVKLIREAGKKVEEEKLREGWSREEAFKYAEAVTTYLAMVLVNFVRHNALVNHWEGASWQPVRHVLAMRGIAMQWNWCDVNPYHEKSLVSYQYFNGKNLDGLSYLVSATSGSPSRVRVLLDDATVLGKLGGERFDVIVTDPPYRDDVPYAELSDFYYVWLRRALSDDGLVARFHGDALVYATQWEALAVNEISYNRGRMEYFGVREPGDHYVRLLGLSFRRMAALLENGGVLVTYFAHSSPEAWIELVGAGWGSAGLRVTKAWNVSTESVQRVTARGKTALESSIVVVWRKRGGGERVGEHRDVYREALDSARRALEAAKGSGLVGSDLFLATMVGALSVFTSYDRVVRFGEALSARDVVKESYAIATRVISGAGEAVRSAEALFYLAAKAIYRAYSRPEGQLTLDGVSSEPIVLSSQDVIILSYGFLRQADGGEKEGVQLFQRARVIAPAGEGGGARVAKQKAFVLLEPLEPSLGGIKEALGRRRVDTIRLEAPGVLNSVDVLHLLEFYARQGREEFDSAYRSLYNKASGQVREAVEMARVVRGFVNDPESVLARLVVDYVEGR